MDSVNKAASRPKPHIHHSRSFEILFAIRKEAIERHGIPIDSFCKGHSLAISVLHNDTFFYSVGRVINGYKVGNPIRSALGAIVDSKFALLSLDADAPDHQLNMAVVI